MEEEIVRDVAVFLIIGAALLGGLAFLFSYVGIMREEIGIERGEEKEFESKEEEKNANNKGLWILDFEWQPKHLKRRRKVIDELGDKKSEKDGETLLPVLPEMSDFHELSLHRESHRSSTTWLHAVVSVLLIMGICGTMLGVHGVLDVDDGSHMRLEDILSVLEPAKTAVVCALIALILKELYARGVESCMVKLDSYTICELLPSKEKKSIGEEKDKYYRDRANDMKDIHGQIDDFTRKCDLDHLRLTLDGLRRSKPTPSWANFAFEVPEIRMDEWGINDSSRTGETRQPDVLHQMNDGHKHGSYPA